MSGLVRRCSAPVELPDSELWAGVLGEAMTDTTIPSVVDVSSVCVLRDGT